MYYWCPKCRALIHEAEVSLDFSHDVAVVLTAAGGKEAITHTGLTPEVD